MRTILVHVNVEIPDDSLATAADVRREMVGALEVGAADLDNTPALASGHWTIPMAEEV